MKRAMAVCGAVAMLLVATSAFAQGKTDFSGKWTIDAEKTAAANPAPAGGGGAGGGGGRGGGGAAGPMTIKQDATTLTIERAGQDGAVNSTVYKIDGTEFTVMQGQNEAKGKASWDGAKLKLEITTANGVRTTVYAIEGGDLVVANTNPGRNGGEPTTRKTIYKKG
jgi:hypothetical protein